MTEVSSSATVDLEQAIRVERDGPIATVLFDRAAKLNAFTEAMWRRLGETVDALSADDDVRCVVLRGDGDRAFSVGADIGEFKETRHSAERAMEHSRRGARSIESILECRHPVVASISGYCVGGGLEIAACCDLRICGESSRFGIPIKRLGLTVQYADLEVLLELIGPSNVKEILFEGRILKAAEAKAMGLVNRIVPDADVVTESYATAARIAEGAPLAARWHKKFIHRLRDATPLIDEDHRETYACFDTEDFRTGYQAFLAKRKPEFEGR